MGTCRDFFEFPAALFHLHSPRKHIQQLLYVHVHPELIGNLYKLLFEMEIYRLVHAALY